MARRRKTPAKKRAKKSAGARRAPLVARRTAPRAGRRRAKKRKWTFEIPDFVYAFDGALRACGAWLLSFGRITFSIATAAAVALVVAAVMLLRDMPDTSGLWSVERHPSVTLLDRHGRQIAVFGQNYAEPIRLRDLPDHLPNAVIAVEDRNFRHHIGINPVSVTRAALANLRAGRIEQGGSTITQQLAKNLFLTPDKTLQRKIQEMALAFWLEARFTKDQILTLYLNRVYFGGGAYGAEAAAQRYFGKSARDVTAGEAAVLAGLLKAPSHYTPRARPQDAAARATFVLDQMTAAGFLTPQERAAAAAEPVRLAPRAATRGAHYFLDHVAREMSLLARPYQDDLVVWTTLDLSMQAAAERAVLDMIAEGGDGDVQAAALILDPRGGMRAMVGGRDYATSQFNRSTQARRQPGSAFKPFVYLAALEAGYGPDDRVRDAPVAVGRWTPDNFKDRYYGRTTLAFALSRSLNSAAVRLSERVGRRRVVDAARRLGVASRLSGTPSIALGASEVTLAELTGAYAAFGNGGFRAEPYAILRIETDAGERLMTRPAWRPDRVIAAETASAMNEMLGMTVREGTGRRARIAGVDAAGKTGTSQAHRDAWFVGHAAGLTGGVWFGKDDNAPMTDVTGGTLPAETWGRMMGEIIGDDDFTPPEEVAPVRSASMN